MPWYDRFRVKSSGATEEKSDTSGLSEGMSTIIYGKESGAFTVRPLQAYQFYKTCAPLADAVDKIVDSIVSMRIGITDGEELDPDAPFVSLLKSPGREGRLNFFSEIVASYLLTREIWLIARGNVNREPLELTYELPYNIIMNEGVDKYPESIQTNSARDRRTYYRNATGQGVRYIDRTGLNELIPIIGKTDIDCFRGMSKLNSILQEIRQNEEGKRHNLSLLQNGMKPSTTITPKAGGILTNKQVSGLRDALQFFNASARNAGKSLILNQPLDVQDNMRTNSDMDYLNLLNKNDTVVYNRYNIPQPLVSPENMTLSNYSTAQIAFYDNAVLPTFREIAGALVASLAHRYDLDGLELVVDENSIPALKSRMIDQMKGLKETMAVVTNEVRAAGAYAPVVGGDTLLVPANLIPVEATVAEGD